LSEASGSIAVDFAVLHQHPWLPARKVSAAFKRGLAL
jgi:hypothetical protein